MMIQGDLFRKVLSELDAAAAKLEPPSSAIQEALDALRTRFVYSQPRIAIVGGEGVGKSSLVNALLGSPYAPTHASRPSTAVPIIFAAANGEPHWRIVDVDGEVHIKTPETALRLIVQFDLPSGENNAPLADSVDFGAVRPKRFWLWRLLWPFGGRERHGRRSAKQLKSALVRDRVAYAFADIKTERLPHGVQLLDLPGIEGVNDRYSSKPPPAGLIEGADIVVVTRGRAHGPAIRLMGTLAARSIDVSAVIVNVSIDDLSVEKTAEDIEAFREGFVLACENADIVPPDTIFVLDTRRVYSEVADDVLSAFKPETEAFSNWFEDVVKTAPDRLVIGNKSCVQAAAELIVQIVRERGDYLSVLAAQGSELVSDSIPALRPATVTSITNIMSAGVHEFKAIKASVLSAAEYHLDDLLDEVRRVQQQVRVQDIVVAIHLGGWRDEIHSKEFKVRQKIARCFEEKVSATIEDVWSELAATFVDPNKTWPITRATIADRLKHAALPEALNNFSPPYLPSVSAEFGIMGIVQARKPILDGLEAYAQHCSIDVYRFSLERALDETIETAIREMSVCGTQVMSSWRMNHSDVRSCIARAVSQLGSVEADVDKALSALNG